MKTRPIIILACVAIVLVIAAFIVAGRGTPHAQTHASQEERPALLPDLPAHAKDIASITIQRGATKAVLRKDDKGAWTLPEKGGYPVEAAKVASLLAGLAQAKEIEPKTANPDLYSRLGVDDPAAEKAVGVGVTLADAKGAPIAGVIVGKPAEAAVIEAGTPKMGRYAREAGKTQSYLTTMSVDADPDPMAWVNRVISELKTEQIERLVVTHPPPPAGTGETITIVRKDPAGADFTLDPMPEGRKLKDESAARRSAVSLSYVNMDDVRPAGEIPADAPAIISTFRRADGMVVKVRTVDVQGKKWCLFAASYEPTPGETKPGEAKPGEAKPGEEPKPEAPATPQAGDVQPNQPAAVSEHPEHTPQTPAPGQPTADSPVKSSEVKPPEPKPAAEAEAKIKKEVDDLNARWAAWAFSMPQFKLEQIAPTLGSLLAPPEPVAPTAPGGPAGPELPK